MPRPIPQPRSRFVLREIVLVNGGVKSMKTRPCSRHWSGALLHFHTTRMQHTDSAEHVQIELALDGVAVLRRFDSRTGEIQYLDT